MLLINNKHNLFLLQLNNIKLKRRHNLYRNDYFENIYNKIIKVVVQLIKYLFIAYFRNCLSTNLHLFHHDGKNHLMCFVQYLLVLFVIINNYLSKLTFGFFWIIL